MDQFFGFLLTVVLLIGGICLLIAFGNALT